MTSAAGNIFSTPGIASRKSNRDGRGDGSATTTIDGGGAGSCVYLDGFDGGTIRSLTLRNGSAAEGGGIHADGGIDESEAEMIVSFMNN